MLEAVFILITLLSLVLFYLGTGRNNKFLAASIAWLCVLGIASSQGFFENTDTQPPRFALVPAIAIPLAILCYRSIDRRKLRAEYLLGVHALRLPVELVLYQLFLRKQVPVLMTFKGWNWDILMGISAIVILIFSLVRRRKANKRVMLFWNIAGLLFLSVIVAIAVLSSPLPIQELAFDQPNIAVLKFPFIFLPAYVVPIVFLSHVLGIVKQD